MTTALIEFVGAISNPIIKGEVRGAIDARGVDICELTSCDLKDILQELLKFHEFMPKYCALGNNEIYEICDMLDELDISK